MIKRIKDWIEEKKKERRRRRRLLKAKEEGKEGDIEQLVSKKGHVVDRPILGPNFNGLHFQEEEEDDEEDDPGIGLQTNLLTAFLVRKLQCKGAMTINTGIIFLNNQCILSCTIPGPLFPDFFPVDRQLHLHNLGGVDLLRGLLLLLHHDDNHRIRGHCSGYILNDTKSALLFD